MLQSYNRECYKTSQMGERIDTLSEENKKLRGIAAEFEGIKKLLGKDKLQAAIEAAKQEKALLKEQRKKQKQYTR